MKLTLTLPVLVIILTLTLSAGIAQGDMIEGSGTIGAYWAEIDGLNLASSSIFTPFAPAPATMYLVGKSGDLAGVGVLTGPAAPLDINTPTLWTFSNSEGDWSTSSFVNVNPAAAPGGYLEFLLTGVFTPKSTGTLFGFDPTPARLRIALNHGGASTSWSGTMNMVPEPMSMSILALGAMTILKPKRRK
ncbi:MAG: hypothetical protein HN350_11315 [Phycisphaerales bacterium]|nr:hypothetical protein [Phycisphaerales bacterium]